MNVKILINKGLSKDATDFYLSMVAESAQNAGKTVEWISRISSICEGDTIVTVDAKDAFRVFLYSKILFIKVKIITWYQGVVPEEAFLVFNSWIRRFYWCFFEIVALKVSYHNLFVSRSMRMHYFEKYGYCLENHTIIPCFNVDGYKVDSDSFNRDRDFSFVYAGSMAKWQKIDETISFFTKVQNECPDASLKILTADLDSARRIIKDSALRNCEVKYVESKFIADELLNCKYGFVLRDDIAVNRVATPTKINTYLSSGVVPIFSSCIGDFKVEFKGHPVIMVDDYNEDALTLISSFESKYSDSLSLNIALKNLNNIFYDANKYRSVLSEIFDD